jgi:hypothetical protein
MQFLISQCSFKNALLLVTRKDRNNNTYKNIINCHHHHHHHHHVHEGLGVCPVPWPSKWNWTLHLFLGRPMFLRPFCLYCNACFGILIVSILCMCCSHFSWYFFISFTIFCAPVLFPNILMLFFMQFFYSSNQNTHKILKRKKGTDTQYNKL